MPRKADTAKLEKPNLKLKTLNLKPYTDKWEPEGLTSEVLQDEIHKNPRTVLLNSALPIFKHVEKGRPRKI